MLKIIIEDHGAKHHSDDLVRHNIKRWQRRGPVDPVFFVPGGTLALQPGWCDDCGYEKAWIGATGTSGFCKKCHRKRTKKPAGFSTER